MFGRELRRRLDELEDLALRMSDQESIRDLVYEYQRLCDGGWSGPSHQDPGALKRLFTRDGMYQIDPTREPNAGHTAIESAFVRLQKSMPWIIHYATNPLVRVDGDSAEARVQGFALYKREGVDFIATGTYHGKFRRTSEGWRFASWIFDLAHSRAL